MTKRQVWRYKCDHCKKSGCSAGHMKRHESGCTLNPNRVCRMCVVQDSVQKPLTELVKIVSGTNRDNHDEKLKQLREATSDCPACILATIRQALPFDGLDDQTEYVGITFDFKAECKAWWEGVNEVRGISYGDW